MIGNDVVDFGEASATRRYLSPRYVQRICNLEEQAALAKSARPERYICALFAAKEAAYKTVVKLDAAVVFAHSRFAVSARFDHVRFGRMRLRLRLVTGDDWVHAVTWIGCPSPLHGARCVRPEVDPSSEVRAFVGEHLGRRSGRLASDFFVFREERRGAWDELGPPKLRVAGVAEPFDISLSHDGRWVAFAAPRGAAQGPSAPPRATAQRF